MTALTHVDAALGLMPRDEDVTKGTQAYRDWHRVQEMLKGVKTKLMALEAKE